MDEVKAMNIIYENEWDHTDIHIDLPALYEEDYQSRMMKHNDIDCLLKVKGCGRETGSRFTYYVEGGMTSLEKHYGRKEMKKEDIIRFIEQLISAVDELKKYFLNPDSLLLKPELIFLKGGKYYFCYLPASGAYERTPLCTAFHEVAEYFVRKLDYSETEGVFLVYRIHKETMEGSYDLKKILESYYEDAGKRREEDQKDPVMKESGQEKPVLEEKTDDERGGLSEGAVFCMDDEDEFGEEYTRKKNTGMIAENKRKYGVVRKAVNRIKTGYWGEWEDLITEMDRQNRDCNL